ncbi:amidase [bacterium]|nr:amidase [bacterium]
MNAKHKPLLISKGISRRDWLKQSLAVSSLTVGISGETFGNDHRKRSSKDRESPHSEPPKPKYIEFDGLGLAELVRTKQVTPLELLEDAIDQLHAVNPKINAVASTFFDEAKQAIRRGLPEGPFKGVPFLLKDISFPIKGNVSSYGSKLFEGRISPSDSTAVSRLRNSGLVFFARTRVPELGILPTTESTAGGITRNPYGLDRTAGGSSGGSAAAVAARITPMASASDGGGSIRIPASCCGLFGLKPTRARVPIGPDRFEAWGGLATLHNLTRTVRDSAALLDVTSGPALGDSYHAPHFAGNFLDEITKSPGKLKIAYVSTMPPAKDTSSESQLAALETANLCESLGHNVDDCTDSFGQLFEFNQLRVSHGVCILVAIRRTILARLKELGRELRDSDLEPVTRYYFDIAAQYSGVDLENARATFFDAARTMAKFQKSYDLILTPTLALPPIQHGKITLTGMAQDVIDGILEFLPCPALANWTGQPAMSVPLHQSKTGLPIGSQFFGRFGDEATLFRLAGQLESAKPWKNISPKILTN